MNEQTQPAPVPLKPKKIDPASGKFRSCGVDYYIDTEAMGYERIVRFSELIPVIAFGRKYLELVNFIHDLRMRMISGGDDFKKTYFDVATELTNFDQYLKENAATNPAPLIDDVLRFCALFCVTKDEDMSVVNDRIQEDKITAWKKDMDMHSFFLLARLQVPRYRELYPDFFRMAASEEDQTSLQTD